MPDPGAAVATADLGVLLAGAIVLVLLGEQVIAWLRSDRER